MGLSCILYSIFSRPETWSSKDGLPLGYIHVVLHSLDSRNSVVLLITKVNRQTDRSDSEMSNSFSSDRQEDERYEESCSVVLRTSGKTPKRTDQERVVESAGE